MAYLFYCFGFWAPTILPLSPKRRQFFPGIAAQPSAVLPCYRFDPDHQTALASDALWTCSDFQDVCFVFSCVVLSLSVSVCVCVGCFGLWCRWCVKNPRGSGHPIFEVSAFKSMAVGTRNLKYRVPRPFGNDRQGHAGLEAQTLQASSKSVPKKETPGASLSDSYIMRSTGAGNRSLATSFCSGGRESLLRVLALLTEQTGRKRSQPYARDNRCSPCMSTVTCANTNRSIDRDMSTSMSIDESM